MLPLATDQEGPGVQPIAVEGLDDPRVAAYRDVRDADLRAAQGLFLVEGRLNVKRLIEGATYRAQSVLVSPTALEALRPSLARLPAEVPVFVAAAPLLERIAGYPMHRGCLAVGVRRPTPELAALLARPARVPSLWLGLEEIANAENMGGLFRNALAFGADGVALSPGCVDPLYRRPVRVSMGASLRLPFARAASTEDLFARLAEAGLWRIALHTDRDATPLSCLRLPPGVRGAALMVGAEGAGLSGAALASADAVVTIPMAAGVDSLNAASAAAVALHHLAQASGRLRGRG